MSHICLFDSMFSGKSTERSFVCPKNRFLSREKRWERKSCKQWHHEQRWVLAYLRGGVWPKMLAKLCFL